MGPAVHLNDGRFVLIEAGRLVCYGCVEVVVIVGRGRPVVVPVTVPVHDTVDAVGDPFGVYALSDNDVARIPVRNIVPD
jgi:hypothetical protein